MEMESETNKQLKDIFHEHLPLVFNKEAWDESKSAVCSACQHRLHGESYSCEKCEFHLHKHCAKAPSRIYYHPLHYDCERKFLTLNQASYEFEHRCFVCMNYFKIGYGCDSCNYDIDTNCALASRKSDRRICDFHPHKLVLVKNHKDVAKLRVCRICGEPLLDSMYACVDRHCKEVFHEKCVNSPNPIIRHPCHRKHSLLLSHRDDIGIKTCHLCQKHDIYVGYYYSCFSCNIWIHGRCIVGPSLVLENKKCHEHPFNMLWRQHPFICDACGTEGNSLSYVCVSCHLLVHWHCTSLPKFIKHKRHPHPLSHNYYDVKPFFENKDCRICYDDVKKEHGSYSCLKQDCDYIIHVNCAIKIEDLYYEINEDNAQELIESGEVLPESCITCVIKKNEFGEPLEIKHCFHEHPLLFQEKNEQEENDKQCDGCVQSIFTSFYYCSQCNFFLHKSCANLPATTYDWRIPDDVMLKSDGIFKCEFCKHDCSGFFYHSNYDKFCVCLRCATIPDKFVHPGHQHFLFYDDNYEGRCAACDERIEDQYKCKYCKYGLHLQCMKLPHMAKHKFDRHPLDLSYHDRNEDHEKHYCDICEEERDPNIWFYHCSICDNFAHLKCVLGDYPWIKSGSIYKDKDLHLCPLTFVRKVYLYPKCDICGDPCVDLALECVTCNFIIHWNCID